MVLGIAHSDFGLFSTDFIDLHHQTAIHDCYVEYTMNPFSKIKGHIQTPCTEFKTAVQLAMDQYNNSVKRHWKQWTDTHVTRFCTPSGNCAINGIPWMYSDSKQHIRATQFDFHFYPRCRNPLERNFNVITRFIFLFLDSKPLLSWYSSCSFLNSFFWRHLRSRLSGSSSPDLDQSDHLDPCAKSKSVWIQPKAFF